ncbi:exodeoxyribonuclease X [Escherichia coli]|uniref:Exodeoxyribonuclease X n=1 Tax=Escherichia coli TaxID=562 RepID=A0A377BAS8_ECOLX|nr:exodeoxyribonuclease X [Escherichia coli]
MYRRRRLHHHRALYDCYITAALLIDIMNTSGWTAETDGRYHRTSVVDDDLHLWQIPWQSGFRRCRTRSGYLRWLFNNLGSMSPELRLTLKHYLENTLIRRRSG